MRGIFSITRGEIKRQDDSPTLLPSNTKPRVSPSATSPFL